jgi:hypothetical protein
VIKLCQHLRFALESREPFGIMGECFWQNFDGHVAPELGIVRLIHFAHAASAYGRAHFVCAEFGACG